MPTQLNVEPVIIATEAEEGRAEVVWAYIQVWGCTKGGLKETEGTELRGVVRVDELSQPPRTILGMDLLLEETWGGGGGSDGSDSVHTPTLLLYDFSPYTGLIETTMALALST